MTIGLTFGSVCSGIEAASVAWEPLGFRPIWFAEVDAHASRVLSEHWPGVPNLGDMTTIAGRIDEVGAPDILIGGTPCQAFSIAGGRGGIADERGALSLSFVEIYREIRKRNPSAIAIWENVPGVLSLSDNAFGYLLGGLVGADGPLLRDGRWPSAGVASGPLGAAAWRVLDAQFFGVAQRRRRVFVAASSTVERAAEILFERSGGDGDPQACGEEGPKTPCAPC